jgi:hypothetical protein
MRCVLKPFKRFCDVPRHGDVDGGVYVIPVEGHDEIKVTGPICCDRVDFIEGSEEVNGVVVVCVFNAEIVDDKGECYVARGVVPYAGCVGTWSIAMSDEMALEMIEG